MNEHAKKKLNKRYETKFSFITQNFPHNDDSQFLCEREEQIPMNPLESGMDL